MARIELPAAGGSEVARALALAPHFVEVVTAYEKAVAASRMDRRLHELVRMRIARINDCVICLNWRDPTSGATERMLAAVVDHATSDDFTPAEKVAIEYAERFCLDSAAIPDSLLDRLAEHLTPAEIVDLTLVIGKYLALGRFMQVLGLDQTCSITLSDTGALTVTPSA
jgi:alkylhydroperoxidase family enzyme